LSRQEQATLNWINQVAKTNVSGSFSNALKDGTVLCKLINTVRPDTITKINEYASKFRQAENLNAFNMAARYLGVTAHDAFQPSDLQDEKNLPKVLVCIHSLAQCLAAQGVQVSQLPTEGLEELKAAAAALDQQNSGSKKNYSTLFEQKQAEAQALAKNAHRGTIVKSDTAPVNTGLSFAEANQVAAQKNASVAQNFATRNIVQSGAGQGSSTLSYADQKNAETSKMNKGLHGANSIVRSTERPANTGLSYHETKQAEAQKVASSSFGNVNRNVQSNDRAVGSGLSFAETSQAAAQKHASSTKVVTSHIIRSEDAPSASVLSLSDANAAATQKFVSQNKLTANNIVRSEEAPSAGVLSMADTNAVASQKIFSANAPTGHAIVRIGNDNSGPSVNVEGQVSPRP